MGKKLMILGGSILQLPAIETALEMGIEPVVVDMNPEAAGFIDGVAKEVISTIDVPRIVEAAKKNKVDGVMTLATDMPMMAVAAVAKEMGLVGVSDDTALKATNKAFMREALKEYGVPIPEFFRVKDTQSFTKVVEQFNVPFIVKPADNSGSRGIYLINDLSDKEYIMNAYRYACHFSRSGEIVVEEYMSGPEVSVETMAVDGEIHVIQITDKITTGAPHFVEMGHTQPSRLSEETKERIKEVAIAANKAVGITNGPSHTEIIVTYDGPKIVEIGARLGGDCITTHLVPLSTGVNMVEACIRIALGEKPNIVPSLNRGSAIRYFAQNAGIVKRITGLDEAKQMPGVKDIEVVHGIGDLITDIDCSGSRMGFVIVQGDNADDAEEKCDDALQRLKIEIE